MVTKGADTCIPIIGIKRKHENYLSLRIDEVYLKNTNDDQDLYTGSSCLVLCLVVILDSLFKSKRSFLLVKIISPSLYLWSHTFLLRSPLQTV